MERRPLAVRGTKWANETAKFLAKINLSPNKISILSVLFSLLALLFFYLAVDNKIFLILAALSIQLRLICNLLDGMVAIEYNKKSVYGNLFNDIPDRFADIFIIMGAGIYASQFENANVALSLAWINSILAVFTAYIRVLGTSLSTPTNFSGVMAKPQRMALLTVASIGAFIPGLNLPSLFFALVLMLLGQIITIINRINYIAKHLKQNQAEGK